MHKTVLKLVFIILYFNLNIFITSWHKNLLEKVLKFLGISNYEAMWIAFFEVCFIGGALVYYYV
jgi:hypothetical protein